MGRVAVLSGMVLALVLTAASDAASHKNQGGAQSHATDDRVCASLIRSRNTHFYPPYRQWVWKIRSGCVYTRDLPRPAGCTADLDIGCAAPPDMHVRFQRREYVFHLTFRGVPAKARGLWNATGRRFLVAHDGLTPARERLFIEFSGGEVAGIPPSGPSQGQVDSGPELRWRIMYTLDKKKGLCCPRVDPGSPNISPFEVAPERLAI